MTSRPVLFNGAMVRAILSGAKAQTRRPVKAPKSAMLHGRHPLWDEAFVDPGPSPAGNPGPYLQLPITGGDMTADRMVDRVYHPYAPGDELWVRETWAAPPGVTEQRECVYRADLSPEQEREERSVRRSAGSGYATWTPSIHMERWASRITLGVLETTVQRAHDITEADVLAEGVPQSEIEKWTKWLDARDRAGTAYGQLWDSVYGKKPGLAWAKNPWVWVTRFELKAVIA